jgi:hypothetical protein
MEYGKNLINKWSVLQESAGIAKALGCSVMADKEPGWDSRNGKNDVADS